jgi:hypothetical protein
LLKHFFTFEIRVRFIRFSLLWGESKLRIRQVFGWSPLPVGCITRAEAHTHFKFTNIFKPKGGCYFMKDKKLSIRISEADLIKIHDKAAKSKLNFTEYVTKACLGRQIFVVEGLDKVLRQQKAIGRNLNQLTTLANMGRVTCVNLSELTEQVAAVNQSLFSLLERKRWSDGNG